MTDSQEIAPQDQEIVNQFDPKYFFFDFPLYEIINLSNEEDEEKAVKLLSFDGNFNAYNYELKENSTFCGVDNSYNERMGLSDDYRIFDIDLKCRRTGRVYTYYVRANNKQFQKVGQYPSLATLNISLIREYDKVLSKEKMEEFVRGIGLRAHGVGIGSFVYLRRIFEYLIEEEHIKAKETEAWDEVAYQKSRMIEKIDLLVEYLPTFLIENKELYGILSTGIHELSEEECLRYFSALKMGIEEILDEKAIEQRRAARRMASSSSVKKIKQEIGK